MQKDKAREAAKDGEVMKDRHGMCIFCHQVLNVRTPETWSDAEADEMATEECKCDKSKRYTTRKSKIERLDKAIKTNFGPGTCRPDAKDSTIEAIRAVAIEIIDGNLNKVSMELPFRIEVDSEKLKMSVKDTTFKFGIEKKNNDITTI